MASCTFSTALSHVTLTSAESCDPPDTALQILDTRTEAPEVLGALNTLSSFYEDNTPAARRQLHATVVRRGLNVNTEFLAGANQLFEVRHRRWLCVSERSN